MDRLLIDTNVLIDVITDRDQPHVIHSQRLFAEAYLGHIEIYVSSLSLVTTVYVGRKYHMSEEMIKRSLKRMLAFMNLTDISAEDAEQMLSSDWSDYEDSLQYQASRHVSADYLITGNVKDFAKSEIPVKTPQEYLEQK